MATRKRVTTLFGFWGMVFFTLAFSGTALATALAPESAPQVVSLVYLLSLFIDVDAAIKWASILGLGAWLLTQAMAWLPPEWVAKLPSWVIKILKWLAGNYRRSANESTNDPEHLRRTR